jgi:hypothetical protein
MRRRRVVLGKTAGRLEDDAPGQLEQPQSVLVVAIDRVFPRRVFSEEVGGAAAHRSHHGCAQLGHRPSRLSWFAEYSCQQLSHKSRRGTLTRFSPNRTSCTRWCAVALHTPRALATCRSVKPRLTSWRTYSRRCTRVMAAVSYRAFPLDFCPAIAADSRGFPQGGNVIRLLRANAFLGVSRRV